MPKIIDLTGRKFGRLIAIKKHGQNKQGINMWLCKCDCGKETVVQGRHLTNGNTKSCGCLHSEVVSKKFKTHGMRKTRIYRIWQDMKSRCLNPNFDMYKYYGARGVKICDRWVDSFENFYADMKEGYSNRLTLDRINSKGDYCKENCKWSTVHEQANNKSNNRKLTYNGETDSLANLCKKYNKNYGTIKSRLRYGWSVEKAFSS